jgi:hypothetical protein
VSTAHDKLSLARRHLERVRNAWEPPDWTELSLFGFYALEAAVDSAATHAGLMVPRAHWARVQAATKLHIDYGLPDVESLLTELNEVRKSEVYGDGSAPELDAEEVARSVEDFVDAVSKFLDA